jgi:2-polyprenyl-3-methyl-5-hydroxy-6-metoxy-1,4-benzoquinol methylase
MPIRIHKENINTADFFNKMWKSSDFNKFDTVRMQALCKHIKANFSICDLGCGLWGFGEFAAHEKLCSNISVVDFSVVALYGVKQKYPNILTYNYDVLVTMFEDGVFDLVGAGELIEHIERPELLAKEMARICKPGGWLTISSVNPDCEDAKKLEYKEHIWKFTIEELVDYFKPYGKTTHTFIGNYHLVETQKY